MVRSATTRPPLSCWRVCIAVFASLALATFVAGGWSDVAHAQTTTAAELSRSGRSRSFRKRVRPAEKAPMLLQATEINYDYVNKRVSAVGSVQIYYSGSTLEADRVIYDETTKRMHAEGNVRLTDANGQITYGDLMNLSEDFRDGFVDSLRLETADQTRMAAARADRSSGDFTVFQSGVYTACEPCKDDPRKPPLWQIKASRIIHDTGEKMIYFENAHVEFFGTPMAYFPYLSTPDPTVKRKSGFLYPVALYSSIYGAGIQVPYYWALAPDYDLTITPRLMSRQGLLMKGEWRQRLDSGYYTIALSGIYQLDKDYFLNKYHTTDYPSYRDFRGSIETRGRFAITDKWNWGWDGLLPTDSLYYSDYGLSSYQRNANFVLSRIHRRAQSGLHHRPRQPQLFRCAQHLLLRLLRRGRAEPDSDHPSGGRLLLHLRPAGVRRRARLPNQPDEPEPQHGVVRPNLATRDRPPACASRPAPIPWPRSRPTVCCAAFRATTTAFPPRRTGSAPTPTR